jgi:hypothetical protein
MGFSPEPSCEPALKREKKERSRQVFPLKQGFHLAEDRFQIGKKEES